MSPVPLQFCSTFDAVFVHADCCDEKEPPESETVFMSGVVDEDI